VRSALSQESAQIKWPLKRLQADQGPSKRTMEVRMATDAHRTALTEEQHSRMVALLHGAVNPDEDGTVYFARMGDNGPIKIGYSFAVERRMVTLRYRFKSPFTLLATRDGGRDREGAYHFQFRDHYLGQELFDPAPAILAEIERLNAPSGNPMGVL